MKRFRVPGANPLAQTLRLTHNVAKPEATSDKTTWGKGGDGSEA